jgi:hypothetical protein
MPTAYENNSQFLEGTETVDLHVTDSAAAVEVEYALAGQLTFKEAMSFGTANVETDTVAIELDVANLSGSVPKRGSKIVRADGSSWRVGSVDYDNVIKVYRCLCSRLK